MGIRLPFISIIHFFLFLIFPLSDESRYGSPYCNDYTHHIRCYKRMLHMALQNLSGNYPAFWTHRTDAHRICHVYQSIGICHFSKPFSGLRRTVCLYADYIRSYHVRISAHVCQGFDSQFLL